VISDQLSVIGAVFLAAARVAVVWALALMAAHYGRAKLVMFLIERGAQVKQHRDVLLLSASYGGCTAFARQLIADGAAVNAVDGHGMMPVEHASAKEVRAALRRYGRSRRGN